MNNSIPMDVLIIAVFFNLVCLFNANTAESQMKEANFVDSPPVSSARYITREQWLGKPPHSITKLEHPVDLVIIAHTVTSFCTELTKCSKIVESIQNYHLKNNYPDIIYNFLIGGDGNIYIGRGFDVQNGSKKQPSISVSFIGNFINDYLNAEMIYALEKLLSDGVAEKKLTNDYKIVAHNQTFNTLSPGIHVYDVIKNFEHFQPGIIS